MISVTFATPEDIHAAYEHRKDLYASEKDILSNALSYQKRGYVLTLKDESGNIGCVVGAHSPIEGVLEAFAITTKYLDLRPLGYTRQLKRILAKIGEQAAHRVSITCRKGERSALRWADVLGFQSEGILRKYGSDKSDYILFGRVW